MIEKGIVLKWNGALVATITTARMINVIKITFQLLLVINMIYITGVVRLKSEEKKVKCEKNLDTL